MAFGLGELRLAPSAFWAMTPRELASAAGAREGTAMPPLTRVELQDLMTIYPDEDT